MEVHYYEIVIVAKNPAPGPSGKFDVRFYPITEDYTFKVRTENYQNFDEKSFIEDLTDLRASDDRPIINDFSIENTAKELKFYMPLSRQLPNLSSLIWFQ